MVSAIILAAGFSSRAKTNKMVLKYKGKALLSYAIEGLKEVVDKVYVVGGHYINDIEEIVKQYENVEVIKNEHYEDGMFSSVLKGISMAKGSLFILPGDCPFVNIKTYKTILDNSKDKILVPTFNKKEGHPIFIPSTLVDTLKKEPKSSNLRLFKEKMTYDLIEVDDKNILLDIDTIEDFNNLNI